MDAYDCNDCGLRWGPEGSHPPCLELPSDERRALYDEIRKRQSQKVTTSPARSGSSAMSE